MTLVWSKYQGLLHRSGKFEYWKYSCPTCSARPTKLGQVEAVLIKAPRQRQSAVDVLRLVKPVSVRNSQFPANLKLGRNLPEELSPQFNRAVLQDGERKREIELVLPRAEMKVLHCFESRLFGGEALLRNHALACADERRIPVHAEIVRYIQEIYEVLTSATRTTANIQHSRPFFQTNFPQKMQLEVPRSFPGRGRTSHDLLVRLSFDIQIAQGSYGQPTAVWLHPEFYYQSIQDVRQILSALFFRVCHVFLSFTANNRWGECYMLMGDLPIRC